MRRHVFLMLILLMMLSMTLGACVPDRAKDVTACQAEADRFFQSSRGVNTDDPRSQFIIACMTTKGYDFTVSPDDCDSRRSLPTQAACYVPSSWLPWIVDQFRSTLTSG